MPAAAPRTAVPPWLRRCALLPLLMMLPAGCRSPGGVAGASSRVPRIDLTAKIWFPPVVTQQGNSCAQQAGLYYLLTAERNRDRGLSSWTPWNRLSPYQAYAILADSMTAGTHVTDGWELALETGVPREVDLPRGGRGLMHGFDKYVQAASRRPASWQLLPLRTESDLRAVKDQLAAGHPVACDFQVRGATVVPRPGGGSLVREWGSAGPGHTMVYAGYDDAIGADLNGDGRLTNDLDITGDGRVTLADRELGAFLVVNPWGPRWGTGGKAWALYRHHAVVPWPRSGEVAVVRAAKDAPPRRMLRISLSLRERRDLTLSVSDGSHHVNPLPFRPGPLPYPDGGPANAWEVFGKVHRPTALLSSGPLTNAAGGPLEMGLDLSGLTSARNCTLTLSSSGSPLRGTLHSASVVELNPAGRIVREIPFPGLPVILNPSGGHWTTPP